MLEQCKEATPHTPVRTVTHIAIITIAITRNINITTVTVSRTTQHMEFLGCHMLKYIML